MVSYQTALYLAYDMAGQLRSQQGEIKLALRLAGQARTVLERLVDQHPKELIFQIHLSRCHGFIGRLLYRSRRFTEALRSFQRAVDLLESLPQLDPANSYQLAVNLALCVSLIGAGPASAPPDDEAELSPADRLRRQIYGTRAVTALNRAWQTALPVSKFASPTLIWIRCATALIFRSCSRRWQKKTRPSLEPEGS